MNFLGAFIEATCGFEGVTFMGHLTWRVSFWVDLQ